MVAAILSCAGSRSVGFRTEAAAPTTNLSTSCHKASANTLPPFALISNELPDACNAEFSRVTGGRLRAVGKITGIRTIFKQYPGSTSVATTLLPSLSYSRGNTVTSCDKPLMARPMKAKAETRMIFSAVRGWWCTCDARISPRCGTWEIREGSGIAVLSAQAQESR